MFEASGRRNRSFNGGQSSSSLAEMGNRISTSKAGELAEEKGADASPALGAAQARLDQLLSGVARGLLIDLKRGNLVLRGKVSSFYQKQLAQEAVKRIEGVRQVTNCIEVAP